MPNNRNEEREAKRISKLLLSLESDELRERMQRSQGNPILWMPLVVALTREKRQPEALLELGRVIESHERGAQLARRWRAGMFSQLGRYEEAIDDLQHVIGGGDEQPANFYTLGNLHYRLGDVGGARAQWRRAVEASRTYYRTPRSWSALELVVWLGFKTLMNVSYYARIQLVRSYLNPFSLGRSA